MKLFSETDPNRKWLAKKLAHAHEPSLENRLLECLRELPFKFGKGQLEKFAKNCAVRRNDISHRGERVHPEVLAVMQEMGIDLSSAKPQKLTEGLAKDAQLLITMGCGERCPYVPGLRRGDWPLRDPKGRPLEDVRDMRGDLKRRVKELIDSENVTYIACGAEGKEHVSHQTKKSANRHLPATSAAVHVA